MMKRSQLKWLWIILWMLMILMACTLSSSSEETPVVEPRDPNATATSQPPLTYATPLPGTESAVVVPDAQQERIDVAMYQLLNQVQEDRLMRHISALVGFGTRHVNSPSDRLDYGVGAAESYIADQFEQIQASSNGNFRYFEQPFTLSYNGITTVQKNVIGVVQGTDEGAGVIIVGAHYDSRTWDLTDASASAPGAADNGSGVAAVIEMARILSAEPRRASLMFVLFSAEEVGAEGSKALVRDYLQAYNITDVVMINVDTIGSWNDPQGNINDRDIRLFSSPPNDSPARQLARSLNFIAYNHDLDLEVIMQDAIDREGRYGDHNSFDAVGMPAVRFIEALEDTPNREGNDTLDKVESGYLAACTRTILGIVSALADGPPPPKNITLRDMGDGTASLVWEPVGDAARYVVGLRSANSMIFDREFSITTNRTEPWDGWYDFESIAIAAVDENGLIGRFSEEIIING